MADPDPGPPTTDRSELFEAAWRRTEWPLSQLWVQYLSLGGTVDLFSLDAFLHGMTLLSPTQQDILATAINEQLDDLYLQIKVPYLCSFDAPPPKRDPLTVLDELFGRPTGDGDSPA